MKIALSLLGQEVIAVSWSKDDVTSEEIAEIIAKAVGHKDEEETGQVITGGGQYERDHSPIAPEDRHRGLWDDRFGFKGD